ncbi:transcriptional regulator, TetR family [Ferrithrix thermotolerans DSM 19514]|uniref:Transcriptional regulator, TetR family n=1 Tax=Ferrithrix thermotolerans DSM 19514 TaxID=1121881 RepID=A0A1M4V0B0_9ACTN|nr:TetR/AcrR family transcriptional regulator C-terminal domain-containing protein [Ferrithrix thermotolerans]SHE62404.1 transcriptional regulator, TetR family [Ferrithrix thermotolerans DSM 19514]
MARPKTPLLNKEKIAEAALKVIEEQGEQAYTLGNVARELNVKTSSLYNHIRSKDELTELVRAVVTKPIDSSVFDSLPWDQALIEWARSYIQAFAAHPNTIKLLATKPVSAPVALYMYEGVVRGFLEAGWPLELTATRITAVESFLLGSAIDMVAPEIMIDTNGLDDNVPLLKKSIELNPTKSLRAKTAFEIGISALANGLKKELEEIRARSC